MAARFIPYRNYRFVNKDPACDAARTMIRSDEHLNNNQVHAISGVAAATIHGWLDGGTMRPQNASLCQVAAALGYVRADTINARGEVEVRFVKVRDTIDYRREIEKQADWILKHQKAKTNGKAHRKAVKRKR